MKTSPVNLQPAQTSHSAAIKKLIRAVGINPMDLDWRHFIMTLNEEGELIGCGQIKTHRDGSRELASIAVRESHRGRGVAHAIIEKLMADNPPPLYLTCRYQMESFYRPFGFRPLTIEEMPPYFKRLSRLAGVFTTLTNGRERMSVMLWNGLK